ncbi:MAG: hypothetical protein AAB267_00560 [Candidatus Desantisbacteria bacterium]
MKIFLILLVVAILGLGIFKLFTKKEKVIEVEVSPVVKGNIVKAKINGGVGLRLDAGLEAEIEVSNLKNVLLTPLESIIEAEGGDAVYVVKDGKAHLRQVKIGIWGEMEAEAKKGLKKGEKVITVGALDVSDGARVKVKKN